MLPTIGITIGDPAGIGPEIALRVAGLREIRTVCRPVLIGDRSVLEAIRPVARCDREFAVYTEATVADALSSTPVPGDAIEMVDCGFLAEPVTMALPCAEGGRACYEYVRASIRLAWSGAIQGVTTAPINKLALSLGGIEAPGHTEIFGEATASPNYAMMMYSDRLAVGLVTIHQSLASVPGSLDTARIVAVGELLADAVERLRGQKPRIAVLGLNPHSGESGLLGTEDDEIIEPAVRLLREEGYDAEGPVVPDSAFTPVSVRKYQAHLCMYHDQGLIPFKMVSFEDGVNVTMGLPFPRTSPDHGTAYDIAGTGTASLGSIIAAVKLAARLAV